MARYAASWSSVTCVATADTTNMTDAGYPLTLQGGSSTMLVKVNEVYIGGEDTASTPTSFILARDSQVSTGGLTIGRNAATDGSTTAPGTLIAFGNTSATNKSQRSATLQLLHPAFNTFGGIFRWQARYGEELSMVGNTASLGELSLSSITGTGKSSGHILYELV